MFQTFSKFGFMFESDLSSQYDVLDRVCNIQIM